MPNPAHQGGASTTYVQALLDYLSATGHPPATLFGPTLSAELADPRQRIPTDRWLALLEQAIFATDDSLPLRLASHILLQHLGILGFAAMSSRTLGDAIAILMRYERLVDDVNETRAHENGDNIELHWLPLKGPASPVFMQLSLATWVVLGRQLTGQNNYQVEAHFSFPRPHRLDAYQPLFGPTIYFDQPITKLVFSKATMALRISYSTADAHRLLVAQAEQDLQAINQPDILQRVRDHLRQHLASGQIALTDTARQLAMSPRTLQYRLSAAGTSYRTLLEDIRQQMATRYLRETSLSLFEIAILLGYSEQAAFYHAFQRWQGKAPGEFRREGT